MLPSQPRRALNWFLFGNVSPIHKISVIVASVLLRNFIVWDKYPMASKYGIVPHKQGTNDDKKLGNKYKFFGTVSR